VTSYCHSLSALNPVERKESQCYSSCSTLPLSRGRSLTGERKGIRRNSTGKRPIDNVSVESAQLNKQTSSKSIDYAECTKSPRAIFLFQRLLNAFHLLAVEQNHRSDRMPILQAWGHTDGAKAPGSFYRLVDGCFKVDFRFRQYPAL
jgi:hypothetical protein